jgi:hypothetical protein
LACWLTGGVGAFIRSVALDYNRGVVVSYACNKPFSDRTWEESRFCNAETVKWAINQLQLAWGQIISDPISASTDDWSIVISCIGVLYLLLMGSDGIKFPTISNFIKNNLIFTNKNNTKEHEYNLYRLYVLNNLRAEAVSLLMFSDFEKFKKIAREAIVTPVNNEEIEQIDLHVKEAVDFRSLERYPGIQNKHLFYYHGAGFPPQSHSDTYSWEDRDKEIRQLIEYAETTYKSATAFTLKLQKLSLRQNNIPLTNRSNLSQELINIKEIRDIMISQKIIYDYKSRKYSSPSVADFSVDNDIYKCKQIFGRDTPIGAPGDVYLINIKNENLYISYVFYGSFDDNIIAEEFYYSNHTCDFTKRLRNKPFGGFPTGWANFY